MLKLNFLNKKEKVGILTINIGIHNIICSFSYDKKTIWNTSSGQIIPKLKGRKKISNVAIEFITIQIVKFLKFHKYSDIDIQFFGSYTKRKSIVKKIFKSKINIKKIYDFTTIPHNGCKLKKRRRI